MVTKLTVVVCKSDENWPLGCVGTLWLDVQMRMESRNSLGLLEGLLEGGLLFTWADPPASCICLWSASVPCHHHSG